MGISLAVFDQSRSDVVYNFVRVCLPDDNFPQPWRRKFMFVHPVYLKGILVKFVYES